jgi:fatty acid desaturase
MDHVALLRSLPPDAKSRLTSRSNAAGLKHLAAYLGAIALTTTGLIIQMPLWPLLLVPQGILLTFLFTLSHECTHQTPFRTAWIHEALGHAPGQFRVAIRIIGVFVMRQVEIAKPCEGQGDHRRNGGRPTTRPGALLYLSGWAYWRNAARTLWCNAFGSIAAPYLPARRHNSMRREARIILAIHVLGGASLIFTPLLLWIWIVPVLIGQPFLRLFLLAEHGLCPQVADMLQNSRTTLTTRSIRALSWNMPFHAEHHSLPSVPFHRLPGFHDLCAAHLKTTSKGYMRFSRQYARSLNAQPPER